MDPRSSKIQFIRNIVCVASKRGEQRGIQQLGSIIFRISLVWMVLGIPLMRGPLLISAEEGSIDEIAKTDLGLAFQRATESMNQSLERPSEAKIEAFLDWWRYAEMRTEWARMDTALVTTGEAWAAWRESPEAVERGAWCHLEALMAERAGDYRAAVMHLRAARDFLQRDHEEGILAQTCERLGRNLLVISEFNEASGILIEAARHYEAIGDKGALARTWVALSGSSTQSVEHRLAGPLEARAIFEEEGDLAQLSLAMLVSGYEGFEDPAGAEAAFMEALHLAHQTGFRESAIHARLGMAEVLLFSGGVAEARVMMEQLLKEVDERAPAPLYASVLRVAGYTAAFTHDPATWDLGLSRLRQAGSIFQKLGDGESQQFVRICLGELLLKMKQPEQAEKYLLLAVNWLRSHQSRFLIEALSLLELAQVELGNFQDAYLTLSDYTDVREDQFQSGLEKRLAELSSKHLATVQQVQLEHLRTTQALNEAELTTKSQRVALLESENARQTMIRDIYYFGFGISLIGALVFIFLYRKKRAAEEHVRELNRVLEEDKRTLKEQSQELTEQNMQFAQTNGRLKEIDEERKRVLGIAAHDMRNPLSAMESAFELLELELNSLRGVHQHQVREILDVGWEGARFLRSLLDRVISARSDETLTERLQLRPIALRAVLRQVVMLNELHANRKGIAIHLEGESLPAVQADAQGCREVFDNILSNALKYSSSGDQVRIYPRVVGGDTVEVRIEDQGPGIPEEEHDRIFRPFSKTSNLPTGGESSTGLGLSTVKDLVMGMRGHVWVEPAAGGGSVFVVSLPIAGSGVLSCSGERPQMENGKKDCPMAIHA